MCWHVSSLGRSCVGIIGPLRRIHPNVEWVVGGGGGWSCDGQQGFVVGDIDRTTGKVMLLPRLQAVIEIDPVPFSRY